MLKEVYTSMDDEQQVYRCYVLSSGYIDDLVGETLAAVFASVLKSCTSAIDHL